LLIYEVKDNLCILSQIGIHADLLGDWNFEEKRMGKKRMR
jgi:hypothetical protein